MRDRTLWSLLLLLAAGSGFAGDPDGPAPALETVEVKHFGDQALRTLGRE